MEVDVIIPTYNQASYVAEAIWSALRQTRKPSRVIVVDDGSTDETGVVCRHLGAQIHYHRQENAGPSAARNAAIGLSNGDAAVFLDSDDCLFPEAIQKAVEAYERQRANGQNVGIIYGDYVLFDDGGSYERLVRATDVTVSKLLRDSCLIPSGTFVTKQCLDGIGLFNGALDICEDWDYWLRASLKQIRFLRVEDCLFKHREHGASLSKREESALLSRARFLQHWAASSLLDEGQKRVVLKELARTYLRTRRALFYAGKASDEPLQRAIEQEPEIVEDPLFFIFGAVYAAPFFRRDLTYAAVQGSVKFMHESASGALTATDRMSTPRAKRLAASARLALAADNALSKEFAKAASNLARAVVHDPSLIMWSFGTLKPLLEEFRRLVPRF